MPTEMNQIIDICTDVKLIRTIFSMSRGQEDTEKKGSRVIDRGMTGLKSKAMHRPIYIYVNTIKKRHKRNIYVRELLFANKQTGQIFMLDV